MVKILLGVLAAIAIAVGGFFGFELYTQHRIADQLDAALQQIRDSGGKASHGKVSFDLLKRTVSVVDLTTESASQPPVIAKIANVTATGVGQPDATHFSADSIEVTDAEISAGAATGGTWHLAYKTPRIAMKDVSGPTEVRQPEAAATVLDRYRLLIEQFAALTASSLTIQNVTGTLAFASPTGGGTGDFAYPSIAMENIKDGKIASIKAGGANFTFATQMAGKADKITGNLANVVSYDLDLTAFAAILDPQKANDDSYRRVYRQVAAGAYSFSSAQGVQARIDGITVDDVGVRPSRLQIAALLAMMPAPGATPDPAKAREMMEKVGGLYEGIHVGNAEIRGMSVTTPQGPLKLAAMRYSLDNGKADVAVEGLDARAPNGPFQIGRLALKSFDIAGLVRMSAELAVPGQPPSPAKALALLHMLEGAEVKGVVAPFKTTGKLVTIDTLSLNWGQFVGPFPTQARLVAKLVTPVDPTDPNQRALAAAGLDKIALDLDLGAAWTEASGNFALAPATIDVGNLVKAQVGFSLANVPRGVFSTDPAQALKFAAQIEAGAVELTLHDSGNVDLAVAQYAQAHNISRDAARSAIVDLVKANGAKIATANPAAAAAVDAVARFVETPGQTLIIKLIPRAKVPALQLVQLLKTDPTTALAQFKIEASTGL